MSTGFTITAMQEADYDEVAQLWRATEGLGDVESRQAFAVFLRRNPDFSPIARSSAGDVVGAMFSGHDGRRGYLSHLAIDSEHRRCGLGSKLVDWALQRLREVPVLRVSVHVYANNPQAIDFWRGVQWRERDDLHVLAFDLHAEI